MSGNGIDLGSIYNLLLQVSKTVSNHDAVLEQHSRILERHGEILERQGQALAHILEVLPTLATKREVTAVKGEVADLRQAVTHYHSSVMGHGILISELEARMRRVEDHLNLSAA